MTDVHAGFHLPDAHTAHPDRERALATDDRGGRRAIVGEILEREGVVALVAHLGLPPFAPPRARLAYPPGLAWPTLRGVGLAVPACLAYLFNLLHLEES